MAFSSFSTQEFEFVSCNRPLEPQPTRNTHECTEIDGYPSAGDGLVLAGKNVCDLKSFGYKGGIGQEEQGMKLEQFEEALSEKRLEGDSPENAIVIADNRSESDADNDDDDYPHNPDLGTQTHDCLDDASRLASDHHDTKGMEECLSSELVEGHESRDSRRLSSTPSTPLSESSTFEIGQPIQEINGEMLLRAHATMNQPQGPVEMKVEIQGDSASLKGTNSNSSDRSENNTDNKTSDQVTRPTCKRRRLLPSKRHCRQARTSNTERKPSDDYVVERIVKARVCFKRLQYRAKWLGYAEDLTWYDASNFKKSPVMLREFHDANPHSSGPPVRLEEWELCCEEDREVEDFPDDDKPSKTVRGRPRAVRE